MGKIIMFHQEKPKNETVAQHWARLESEETQNAIATLQQILKDKNLDDGKELEEEKGPKLVLK